MKIFPKDDYHFGAMLGVTLGSFMATVMILLGFEWWTPIISWITYYVTIRIFAKEYFK